MVIRNISDLMVLGEGAVLVFNMDTMCFYSSEKLDYLPLIRLGLSYHLVEILHFMCSSLWNISLVLELHFHWILGIFVIHEHVIYHVYYGQPAIM